MIVIADAGSEEEAMGLVRELKPDVVLMDIQMPGIGGLEATRRCLRDNDTSAPKLPCNARFALSLKWTHRRLTS